MQPSCDCTASSCSSSPSCRSSRASIERRSRTEALLLGGLVLAPRLREYAYIFAVVFGLCAGSVVALQPAIIAAIVPPELLAHALGFLYMFMSPSVLIVPTLAAVARDRAGGYRIVWEILPFVMAAGAAVLNGGWLIQWYRRRQTVQELLAVEQV